MKTCLSCTGAVALVSFALAAPASASTMFDMEGVAPGFYAGSLVVNDGPLTLTVTPEGNSSGFVDATDPSVALLGSVALIGSKKDFLAAGGFEPLRFSFNQPINSITFNFGDAGGDDDGTVEIRAYSAPGGVLTYLGNSEFIYGKSSAGASLTLNFAGADFFVARSFGGEDENSLYWDIGAITTAAGSPGGTVPEPPAWALMLAGFAGLGWPLRFARSKRTPRAPAAC